MEFRQVVAKRKMVRTFEQRPAPGDVIDRILDVGRRAPSGGFSQGFDFLVLDEPSATTRFWEVTNDPGFPYEAEDLAVAPPVLILPLSDKRAYLERYAEPDKIESAWTGRKRGRCRTGIWTRPWPSC